MLLALLRLGLGYAEARRIGMEEVLCLLAHGALEQELCALDAEAARIASLPLADPAERQRELVKIRHRAAAALERFYRSG